MPRAHVITTPIAEEAFKLTDVCAITGGSISCLKVEDPKDPYTLSVSQLKASVDRMQNVLSDPALHEKQRNNFLRASYVKITHLEEVIELSKQTGAEHVRVYNGIDEGESHFFFMAPITPDGRARDDDSTIAAMCCCKVPPCPKESGADRYIGEDSTTYHTKLA